jgi:hypothetical protein
VQAREVGGYVNVLWGIDFFLLNFETVPTVWYVFFTVEGDFLIAHDKKNPTKIEGNSSVFLKGNDRLRFTMLYKRLTYSDGNLSPHFIQMIFTLSIF